MAKRKSYYLHLLNLFSQYKKGKVMVSTPPSRIWVEIEARCNLSCLMCPNKDLDKDKKGSMSWEIFKKTIDEAREFVQEVNLHHRGESLLHPQAAQFIAYAARHIPMTKLHTNGTLLNKELSTALILSGLTRLSISFDGFQKKDYEKVRLGANFDQVIDNIKQLLAIRRQLKRKKPVVAIEVIELSHSQVEKTKQRNFIKSLKKEGLDELIIKKPHNWAGSIKLPFGKAHYAPCTFLWNAMLILYNGDVVPCAQDFFAHLVIGNVEKKSLRQIWNDEPIKEIRRALIAGKPERFFPCQNCDRLWRASIFGIPSEYLKQMILRRMP